MSTPSTTETALEKPAERTPAVITTPEQYRGALLRWQEQHYNVLTPFSNISGLAASHGIITSLVQINPDKAVGDVYADLPYLKGNVALAKVGLRKLAECAGISTRTERTDDRRIPNYWEFKAVASYRGIDGAIVTREATKEWDLRDGSPQMKGWTSSQIEEGRKHGLRNCEARAINAAIRESGCGIKQAYTREELKKPFAICRVMFTPDMSDPDIKRMVTMSALGGTTAMYPPATHELPAMEVTEDDSQADGPRHVGSGSTSQATAAAPATQPKADADVPPSEGAVRIAEVTSKPGETNGRKWLKYTVVDSNGVEYSTFSKTIGDAADKARVSRAWMDIIDEQNGEYRNIVELSPAGQQPRLPDLENGL